MAEQRKKWLKWRKAHVISLAIVVGSFLYSLPHFFEYKFVADGMYMATTDFRESQIFSAGNFYILQYIYIFCKIGTACFSLHIFSRPPGADARALHRNDLHQHQDWRHLEEERNCQANGKVSIFFVQKNVFF
jgi:hypothetical protein